MVKNELLFGGYHYLGTEAYSNPTKKIDRMLPISIFDYFIYDKPNYGTKTEFKDLGIVFEGNLPMSNRKELIMKIENSADFIHAVLQLYNLAGSKTLMFGHGTKLLTFENQYVEHSTMNHLSNDYYGGRDFLMTEMLERGETIDGNLKKFNTTHLYGPETRAILSMMGYNLGEKSPVSFVDVDDLKYLDFDELGDPWANQPWN